MPTKRISAKQYRIDNGLPVKSNLSPIKSNLSPIKRPKSEPKSGTPRNKWEQEMFNLLTALRQSGVIWTFVDQASDNKTVLQLTKHCKYTPDFHIMPTADTHLILEVKSAGRDDKFAASILRFRIAADLYEQYRFVMLTKDKGKWVVKYDLNKGSAELPKEIVNDL